MKFYEILKGIISLKHVAIKSQCQSTIHLGFKCKILSEGFILLLLWSTSTLLTYLLTEWRDVDSFINNRDVWVGSEVGCMILVSTKFGCQDIDFFDGGNWFVDLGGGYWCGWLHVLCLPWTDTCGGPHSLPLEPGHFLQFEKAYSTKASMRETFCRKLWNLVVVAFLFSNSLTFSNCNQFCCVKFPFQSAPAKKAFQIVSNLYLLKWLLFWKAFG